MKGMGHLFFSLLVFLGLGGCIVADVVETAVEVPIAIVEGTVDTTTSVVSAVADIPPDFKSKYTTEREWTLAREDISLIRADTRNGVIEVKGAATDTIKVKACIEVRARQKRTAECYAEQVDVNDVQKNGELHLYKSYPPRSSKYHLTINYIIETPHNMNLNLHTSNGKIYVYGIHGTVETQTSNGRIKAERLTGSL